MVAWAKIAFGVSLHLHILSRRAFAPLLGAVHAAGVEDHETVKPSFPCESYLTGLVVEDHDSEVFLSA